MYIVKIWIWNWKVKRKKNIYFLKKSKIFKKIEPSALHFFFEFRTITAKTCCQILLDHRDCCCPRGGGIWSCNKNKHCSQVRKNSRMFCIPAMELRCIWQCSIAKILDPLAILKRDKRLRSQNILILRLLFIFLFEPILTLVKLSQRSQVDIPYHFKKGIVCQF
jgi:hypothetical protein